MDFTMIMNVMAGVVLAEILFAFLSVFLGGRE